MPTFGYLVGCSSENSNRKMPPAGRSSANRPHSSGTIGFGLRMEAYKVGTPSDSADLPDPDVKHVLPGMERRCQGLQPRRTMSAVAAPRSPQREVRAGTTSAGGNRAPTSVSGRREHFGSTFVQKY